MTALLALSLVLGSPIEPLLESHGWGRPDRDPALDRVAEGLTARLGGTVDEATASAHLRFLLAQAGVADAIVVPVTARHAERADLSGALAEALPRFDHRRPPTHYGLHQRADRAGTVTAAVFVHRGLHFAAPLPRTAPPGGVLKLSGELRRGYFRPKVVVAPPGQPIRERPAWTEARRAEVNVYLDAGPGRYGVEFLADSQYGPVVLANHTVYVGMPPPPRPVVRVRRTGGGVLALGALIDVHRRRHGLGALAHHPVLTAAAQAHARELAAAGKLDHVSPDSGTLATRLRRRGLSAALAAENLAEAPDAHGAFRAFLDSPGHARNLVLPQLTHMGVARSGAYWVIALGALP